MYINYIFISVCIVSFSSCALFRPLPLKPVHNSDTVRTIERSGLSEFNGDYEILSVDSSFNTLDYTFTYKRKSTGINDYINLSVIDDRHIRATLFVNDKIVKSKKITGRVNNNYFSFHSWHLSWKYVFILYGQQTNRLALSKDGDLYLDTNNGGIAFFLIMPVPLSGSSIDSYNLKFRRKRE